MILDLVIYPDKRLKSISKEVVDFNDGLFNLLDDLYDTMIDKNGIGIAAIQVGVAKRIVLLNMPREDSSQHKDDLIELINPVIVEKTGEIIICQEGCLSVPTFYEDVERFESVVVEYFDRNAQKQRLSASDLLSVAIQHEIDHLNGVVFVERLPMLKRKKFEKEWKKLHK